MSKKASNMLLIVAALSILAAVFDARMGFALSVTALIGFAIYLRSTKGS
jgi:hypothetical protein